MTFWQRVMRVAGTDWCGNDVPPADHLTWHFKEMGCDKVASVVDDGFGTGGLKANGLDCAEQSITSRSTEFVLAGES